MIHALPLEVLHSQCPQSLVFSWRTEILSPPEPRTIALVPGSEDDGNRFSLLVCQRHEESSQTIQPNQKLVTEKQDGMKRKSSSSQTEEKDDDDDSVYL